MPCSASGLKWLLQPGRSTIPQSSTLFPFLYQTSTILKSNHIRPKQPKFGRQQHTNSQSNPQQSSKDIDSRPNIESVPTRSNGSEPSAFEMLEEIVRREKTNPTRPPPRGPRISRNFLNENQELIRPSTRYDTIRLKELAQARALGLLPRQRPKDANTSSSPLRAVSGAGDHYVDVQQKARQWRVPTDLSESDSREKEAEGPSFLHDSESSLAIENPFEDPAEHDDLEGHERETTITDFERDAFDSLFSDLIKKTEQASTVVSESTPLEVKDELLMHGDEKHGELNDLLRSALLGTSTDTSKAQAAEAFPEAIRDIANKALAKIANNEAQANTVQQDARFINDPIVKKRLDELERVSARMMDSKTDVELWQILEEELFSKLRSLDLDAIFTTEEPVIKKQEKKPRGRPPKQSPPIERPKPDLTTLAPNYPLHLLTALRLFTRRTSPPSPLAEHLLPTVKSLGTSSHILGASTALYNELLHYRWHQRGSLSGALSTLRAMEADDIPMDEGTHDLLREILVEQARGARGHFGLALQDAETLEWRVRAAAEIRSRRKTWLKQRETREAEYRASQRDMFEAANQHWKLTEHPGAFGRVDVPPGPNSKGAIGEARNRRQNV